MPCEIGYSIKKGLKGFLLVEFRKGALLVRLRFKVALTSSGYNVEIRENGANWSNGKLRANRVVVGIIFLKGNYSRL